MSTVNTTTIQAKLQVELTKYFDDVPRDSKDVLALALSGQSFNEINVNTVNNVNELPTLYQGDLPSGMIYFVNDIGIFAVSSVRKWLTLDGRFIREDGLFSSRIWGWGTNSAGRLGDGTTVDSSSPVSVVGVFTDWCQVSAGYCHSLGVRANGSAWAWGAGFVGRLGDGTATDRSSPVSVVGGFTDWCGVSAGGQHSLGVRTNGTAWAWGYGGNGRLGDGTTVAKSSPVSVLGNFTDWSQVSAGDGHSLAVRTNGTVWSWGAGTCGRLGDGTTVAKSSPVSVIGGFADWCQVSAGDSHSLAVRTNGTAWAWGSGTFGQLGDGTQTSRLSPVSVVGGFCDWCQVSAGGSHSLGVRTNGSAWAWGAGTSGRLGDGTAVTKSSPVSVVGGFVDWCQVSAGDSHSLAVRTNGTVWSWGSNSLGKLGDGTTVTKSSPVSVIGGFTNWCQVSAGDGHSLALRIKV